MSLLLSVLVLRIVSEEIMMLFYFFSWVFGKYGIISSSLLHLVPCRLVLTWNFNCKKSLVIISYWMHIIAKIWPKYGHLTRISQIIQLRWSRYAWYDYRSKDELISYVLLWTFCTWSLPVLDNQQRLMNISFVRTQDAVKKTCQE